MTAPIAMHYLCDPMAKLRHWVVQAQTVPAQPEVYPVHAHQTTFTPEEALGRTVAQARAEGLPVGAWQWYVAEAEGPAPEDPWQDTYMRGFAEGQEYGIELARDKFYIRWPERSRPLDRIA